MNELEVFTAALELTDLAARSRFLDEVCGGHPEIRSRIDALLRNARDASRYLEPAPNGMQANINQPIAECPGTTIGPYKLLQQIGEGGMGVVYMAEQLEPVKRRVALKIIKPGMDTRQVIARFEAERQALSLMDHPNIAKVLDAGTTESGRPYFVMELVKGQPITQYCDEQHLTPRQRLELLIPFCQAIQHAHQKGIIHRDIKPTNILVAEYDNQPVPKVIDFGVAKATSQALTEKTMFTGLGQIVGTLEYMSPEQAKVNQLDIDTRSDIYSLGVLLYELLTGSTPFDKQRLRSAAFDEMLRIIREEEPPKPSTRLSESRSRGPRGTGAANTVGNPIPAEPAGPTLASIAAQRHTEPAKLTRLVRGELDWIVMKALEKDRNRRYETANGFAMDVQRYLADEPVLACPPSPGYRIRKMVRRNKALITTIAFVSLILILGTVVSTWQAIRATMAEARAMENAVAADKARAEAIANLQTARQAVDQMLTEVGSVDLEAVPQMEPVRRALMEKALKFYQGFLKDRGSDPSTRDGAGSAYRRMGWIHRVLGQHGEAEKALREGVSLFEGLVAEYPAVPKYRAGLANTEGNLASALLHLGRPAEAEKSYRRAYELRQRLATEFPDNLTYLRDQADAAGAHGGVLAHLGRRSEAEKAFEEAYALLEKTGGDPVGTELNKANAAINAGQPDEAKQHLRQALQILEMNLAASPQNPSILHALAQTKLRLGLLLKAAGERSESERIVRESISQSGQLVTDFPSTAQNRAGLAEGYYHLLKLLVTSGQFEEAEQVYRTSLPHVERLVVEAPDRRWYQELLQNYLNWYAEMLSTVDRPQEAEQAYRQALAVSLKMLNQFRVVNKHLDCGAETNCLAGAGDTRFQGCKNVDNANKRNDLRIIVHSGFVDRTSNI